MSAVDHPLTRICLAAVWALAAGVGCEGDGGEAAPEPATTRTPTPYVPDLPPEAVGPEARLDAAAVAGVLAQRLPALMSADVAAVPDRLEALLALGDDACPGGERFGGDSSQGLALENDCATADGFRYRGYLNITRFSEDDGAVVGFSVDAGGVRVDAPDGRFIEVDGYFGGSTERFDEVVGHNAYVGARLSADPGTAEGNPWLDGTFAGRIERWSYREPGGVAMGLDGSVALVGGPASAVSVSGLRLNSWACGAEPAGVFSLREADGAWHDVVFDGFVDEDAPDEGGVCDGCGAHLVAGQAAGAVCADGGLVTALFDEIGR